jgi:hypothetical protein
MTELKLFNRSLVRNSDGATYAQVIELALKVGYIIHPSCVNKTVVEFLKTKQVNYNSTFYKTFKDITDKTRFELFVDQCLHYMSTYGTNFEGTPYIPNDEPELIQYSTYKVILPITQEECIERCEKMLFSGIALKQETIEDVLTLLDEFKYTIDIEKVKNKEAKMFLCKKLGILPSDPVEMVRFLVYNVTGKTLLIKDRVTIFTIKNSKIDISKIVEKFGYEKLSEVFFRFKPIFLAFKGNKVNNKCVNKLRKLANTNHKPLELGYFERLLGFEQDLTKLHEKLSKVTNFKKVLLLQTINIRLKETEMKSFGIRNGKLYMKENTNTINMAYLSKVYAIIYQSLIDSLKEKACVINIPKGVNITIPTSEKSFVGNYPIGTSFDFSETDCIVGINWKNVDGANDLDLSLMTIDGKKYGWNASYTNERNSIIYSGDMTYAEPDATELYYAGKGFTPSIVKVNMFGGSPNSKFKMFLASEKIGNIHKNYMVDPNNVLFTVDMEMDSKEKSLGVLTGEKFILAQFRTGNGRVSYNSITDLYTTYAISILDCYLNLKDVLIDAGFTIAKNEAKIDLTDMSKDTLISLFQ